MNIVTGATRTVGEARMPTEVPAPLPERQRYDGVSCRPMAVGPGPKTASSLLKLRCRLDTLLDRSERRIRWFAIRGLGLGNKIASRVGMGGFYRHIPVMRNWRTPTPITAPIFIVGSPRTGTTILGTLLAHQGGVLYLNEARGIWNCAVPELGEGEFHWRDGEPQGRIYLDETDFNPEAKALLERAFGWRLRFAGRERLVEKMPLNLFRIRWLNAMWPDATFIQVIRDPFSTTASKLECWPVADETRLLRFAIERRIYTRLFPELVSLLDSARTRPEWHLFEWRMYTEEGERLRDMLPRRYCIVRLEDVQRQPEELLGSICEFAGLRFTNRLRRAYKTMLYRRVRMARPQLDVARCKELLGESAARWGYRF